MGNYAYLTKSFHREGHKTDRLFIFGQLKRDTRLL